MLKQNKIAVFFDCENVSAKYIKSIYDSFEMYGEVIVSKAYCDWVILKVKHGVRFYRNMLLKQYKYIQIRFIKTQQILK